MLTDQVMIGASFVSVKKNKKTLSDQVMIGVSVINRVDNLNWPL